MNRLLFDLNDPPPSPPVWSVSELNTRLRETLQRDFSQVWVRGEISDLARPGSGHAYFSLKDDTGTLKAVMWRGQVARLRFDLQDGLEVVCEGQLDVYPPRGTYQLIVRSAEPQGLGGLQLAFWQLHERLSREGLFEATRKRPLPRFPQRIAVVTSPTGAAVRDFLEVLRRRWPQLQVLLVPTRVQGAEAATEIVAALQAAQSFSPAPDCLVLTRGGGSLEDLWCFNDERVVRAVAACSIPTVSAIGHEIDVTLCDLAADIRALTPSEAAERIVPDRAEIRQELTHLAMHLRQGLRRRVQLARSQLDALAQRPVFARPRQRLEDAARRTDELEIRLRQAQRQQVVRAQFQLQHVAGQLEALNPLQVLARGYSLTMHSETGRLIRSLDDLGEHEILRTRVAQGEFLSRIIERRNASDDERTQARGTP